MYINDDWRIASDELNVILQQRKVTKGTDEKPSEEYWSSEGYYNNPHSALKALINKKVLGTGMTDLQTVCDKIDELHRMIEGLNIDVRRGIDAR